MLSWLTRWIERHPAVHRPSLRIWRLFPPWLAGFLKGRFARSWIVGTVAVMVDEEASPPQVLLVKHSYRSRGAWGLPSGALECIPDSPAVLSHEVAPDGILEANLRREVWEELGIGIEAIEFLRADAVTYVAEEPGPYRLELYFMCKPEGGFTALREILASGELAPFSPEIRNAKLVPLSEIGNYDLFSVNARFLEKDLPGLAAKRTLARSEHRNS